MDLFPVSSGTPGPPPGHPQAATRGLVMAYYDGNTVNALWTYAQNFAMNDNSWTSIFGPSTPGAINLISDLTAGEYGGYQAVLAVHAEGSIEAEKLTILAQYERERAIDYARWLGGLDAGQWSPR